MNFSASIPVASLHAANEALEEAGFGPRNFSTPAYAGIAPTHALLHCWHMPDFEAAVAAIAGVVIQHGVVTPPVGEQPETVNQDPAAMTAKVAEKVGATWGATAPLLTGTVKPGLYKDKDGALHWVIQSYNTVTYPDKPAALIRKARDPYAVAPWKQSPDQYESYRLKNEFTGKADECTHKGKTWVTLVDFNVWEPGTQNSQWIEKGDKVVPIEPPKEPPVEPPKEPPKDEWPAWKAWDGNNASLYQVGAKVTHKGSRWVNTTANSHWEPGVFGWNKQ